MPLARSANEIGVNEIGLALGKPAETLGLASVWAGLEARALEALYLAGPLRDLGDLKPPFVVCQDTHWSGNAERADVVLPAAAFAEAGGTWVNTEGRIRTYAAAVAPPGEARTDGEILGALAARLGRPGFARPDRASILREICARVPAFGGYDPAAAPATAFVSGRDAAEGLPLVPVEPPLARRGRRPSARPGAAPDRRSEALRGFDLAVGSPAYARLRRDR
jgi:NADH dehydrogenase/NADH:ubiquinone oxidoreductase subunit G